MDEINPKTFKQIASRLQRVAECPVCLGALYPPVSLCNNGHGVCPDCKRLLDRCPLCQARFSNLRSPLALNQLLEVLPRRCRYESGGCREVSCPGDKHEEFCVYRRTTCRVPGCVWHNSLRLLRDHLRDFHAPPLTIPENETMHFSFPTFNPKIESKTFTPIITSGQFMWQMTRLDVSKRKLFITFYLLPEGPPQGEMFVVVSLGTGRLQFQYSVQASTRDEGDADISSLDSVMIVPQAVLPRLLDADAGLVSSVTVIRF